VTASPSELRFDRFRLDPVRRLLWVDGEPSKLGARAIDVLIALAQRRTRVVGKDELFDLVWPGLVVEENNLQQHVSALRKLLGAQAISTVPGRGYQFIAAVEDDAAQPLPAADAAPRPRDNLPAVLPPLLGRTADVAEVRARLAAATPVTIVGPGGIGKTRLALAVAQMLRDSFDGGVWIVDLTPIDDPAQVAAAVAHTLAIDAPEARLTATIAAALRAPPLLLVLDNCEHLLAGVADLVTAIAAQAPKSRVLATSREPLRLPGEQVIRLAPLALPMPGEDIAAEAPEDRPGAVQLFDARARAADRRFALTAANAGLVGDICRRLDGLPLAIELAAARLPLLGLAALRDRLDDQLRLLTSGPRTAPWRQQTLRAALDWSHGLLSADEQRVFRRLAVFVGGFSLPLVEQVTADDGDDAWATLELLGQLVDKSLVVVEGEAPRYRLLETTRSFALERLAQSGEEAAIRRRHARAMRDSLVAFDAAVMREPRFDRLYRELEPELENIRAALAWAAGGEGDLQLAIGIAALSTWWWNEVDAFSEGLGWCRRLAPKLDASIAPAVAARFHLTYGSMGRISVSDPKEWIAEVWLAIDGFRAIGDGANLYRALCILGGPTGGHVDQETVGRLLDEAAAIEDPAWSPRLRMRRQSALEWWHDLGGRLEEAREAGQRNVALARDAGGVALVGALSNLAETEVALGAISRAIELCREAIGEAQRLGRPAAVFYAYGNMVPALLELGDLDGAEQAIREARVGFVRGLGSANNLLVFVALLVLRRGDPELAARLVGSADRGHRDRADAMHPLEMRARTQVADEVGGELAPERLATLMSEGAEWNEDQAFERGGISSAAG